MKRPYKVRFEDRSSIIVSADTEAEARSLAQPECEVDGLVINRIQNVIEMAYELDTEHLHVSVSGRSVHIMRKDNMEIIHVFFGDAYRTTTAYLEKGKPVFKSKTYRL
jgi:hypothetical protein